MEKQIESFLKRLSIRQLEVFLAVHQERGYVKAAEKLGLTQPAVSSQIRQLEEALGQKVFEYIGRRLYNTPVGNLLAESVTVIFEQFAKLQNDVHALKDQVSGDLNISAVNTAQYVVPYLLKSFLNQHQQVRLSLNFVNRANALERLSNNTDDLTIMGIVPTNRPLESIPFLDNELIPVFPKGHPLLEKTSITQQEFFENPIISRERGSGSRLAVEQHCLQNQLDYRVFIEIGSNEALKHTVISGLGVGVLPHLSVLSELKLGQLSTADIPGFPIKRSWCLVYPSAKSLSPTARSFVDYVRSNLANIHHQFLML
ncbi:MAG: LysR family transcriptional regulator [Gammaproteobacteria bacterium]|nr:LysR family transcriptional regulator [Gammaproteobacteria bacterium]